MNSKQVNNLHPITHPLLDMPNGQHGFFNRHGGVSGGMYESLNGGVGSNDSAGMVMENRARVQVFYRAQQLLSLRQCHSATVIIADEYTNGRAIKADGMVTDKPNLALCILTADCVPLLLVDKINNVIGACHAGWRGAVAGVIENTIATMVKMGASKSHINAVIGPAIGPKSYEVGEDMKTAATSQHKLAEEFFTAKGDGKFLFDLPSFCTAILKWQGVINTASLGIDTVTNDNFFSNRRNRLQGIDGYGSLMSVIMLSK